MAENDFEFKAKSVEEAIEKGLKKLGIGKDDAEIEVISEKGGIFSKAVVKVTPKISDEDITAEANEISEEETVEEEETAENIENAAEENKSQDNKEENRERKNDRRRNERNHRNNGPRERIEYFAEEKAKGKKYIESLVEFFGGNYRIDAKSFKDEICFYINGEGASIFIGHRGETLDAIQYLANQVINAGKSDSEQVRVTVDADFYRERRKRTLSALAKRLAVKSYNEKREIELEPMNSYERRIIHAALQNCAEATTRSEGEGKDRHVVIVPKCEVMTYGTSSDFRKNGPKRVKSFGQQKKIKF